MANCFRCQTETELHENGLPVCIYCASSGDGTKPLSVQPEFNLRDILFRNLISTAARVKAASKVLDEVTGNFPGSRAKGNNRIQTAFEELEAARKELTRAHSRLNDFLNGGIVPKKHLKHAAGQ
jgi:hypothetical protein